MVRPDGGVLAHRANLCPKNTGRVWGLVLMRNGRITLRPHSYETVAVANHLHVFFGTPCHAFGIIAFLSESDGLRFKTYER